MTAIEERERQHLVVLADALGITVGELVWRGQQDEQRREAERDVAIDGLAAYARSRRQYLLQRDAA